MFSLNIFAHNCDEVWVRQKHQSCIIKCGSLLTFYFKLTWQSFHAINWTKWVVINYPSKLVTKWINIIFYMLIISYDSKCHQHSIFISSVKSWNFFITFFLDNKIEIWKMHWLELFAAKVLIFSLCRSKSSFFLENAPQLRFRRAF